jgi:hypothetical protein
LQAIAFVDAQDDGARALARTETNASGRAAHHIARERIHHAVRVERPEAVVGLDLLKRNDARRDRLAALRDDAR